LAPELFSGNSPYTAKSDVFSLGIILWEIFATAVQSKYAAPYSDSKLKVDIQIYYQVSKNNLRPTMPPNVPEPIVALIKRCWDENPEVRPNAEELYQELADLQKKFVTETAPTEAKQVRISFYRQKINNSIDRCCGCIAKTYHFVDKEYSTIYKLFRVSKDVHRDSTVTHQWHSRRTASTQLIKYNVSYVRSTVSDHSIERDNGLQ
jgi:serine/threonine protein kinase